MKRPFLYYHWLSLFLILSCAPLAAASAVSRVKAQESPRIPAKRKPVVSPKPAVVVSPPPSDVVHQAAADNTGLRPARFKLNNQLGLHIFKSSGVVIGSQFGYGLASSLPLYVGPEISFSLLSEGYLLNVLGGGWTEIKLAGAEGLGLHLGAVAGTAVAYDVKSVARWNLSVYLDLALAQDIDDLVTVRGQLHPGYVGGRFAFMMNFNVCFRFY